LWIAYVALFDTEAAARDNVLVRSDFRQTVRASLWPRNRVKLNRPISTRTSGSALIFSREKPHPMPQGIPDDPPWRGNAM
jgi:hypothetical protein